MRSVTLVGMWIFLTSEALFFGSFFLAFVVIRRLQPAAFVAGVEHMNLPVGTANTAILLASSWTLAMGLNRLHLGHARRWFAATGGLGALFLALKAAEYVEHARDGLLPVFAWHPPMGSAAHLQTFFFLYFFLTLWHALHVLVGIILIAINWRGLGGADWPNDHASLLENTGLYWHFVDIIWVFVFSLLYLIGGIP